MDLLSQLEVDMLKRTVPVAICTNYLEIAL